MCSGQATGTEHGQGKIDLVVYTWKGKFGGASARLEIELHAISSLG